MSSNRKAAIELARSSFIQSSEPDLTPLAASIWRQPNEFFANVDPSAEQQRRVDTYFRAESTYWKQVYQREGVHEAIYQQRRGHVLALFDQLGLRTNASILEIGCGAGLTAVALAKRGYVVHAMDTVDAMLALTRRLALESEVDRRVIACAGNICRLAFPDNTFPVVLAIGVTPWLHSLRQPLREIGRVLQPGGYLIISADHRWRLNYVLDPRSFPGMTAARWKVRDVLERSGLRKPDAGRPNVYMYSLKEFDALLSTHGFQKRQGRTLGFGPFSFLNHRVLPESVGVRVHYRLQRWADRGFPLLRSAGSQYVVLAQKSGVHREAEACGNSSVA